MGGLDLFDELFAGTALPLTSATFTDRGGDKLLAPPYVVKEFEVSGKGLFKAGFLSLMPLNSAVARTGSNGRAVVSRDPADQAVRYLPELAAKVDFVVVLGHLGPKDLERVAQAAPGRVHLFLAAFGDRISPNSLETFGGVPGLYAGDQGKRLGEVRVFLEKKPPVKVREMTANLVYLTKRYPEDEKYQKTIEATLRKVNEAMKGQSTTVSQASPGTIQIGPSAAARKFLTGKACRDCHEQADRVWEHSRHAHAMETLVKANQDYNPECVKCHTTGFGTLEGFQTMTMTPALANVQCEACHGSGTLHIQDASRPYGRVAPRVCFTCHTKENSPEFSFFKYWETIKH